MYLLKNYNHFVTGTRENPKWEDFYIHRFLQDRRKLVTFPTIKEAQDFLDQNPDLEEYREGWIERVDDHGWH